MTDLERALEAIAWAMVVLVGLMAGRIWMGLP